VKPYLNIFGLVLIVYGLGGVGGILKKATATGQMDWVFFTEHAVMFVVLIGIGLGMMVKAYRNRRSSEGK
jgi:hypothetical protein